MSNTSPEATNESAIKKIIFSCLSPFVPDLTESCITVEEKTYNVTAESEFSYQQMRACTGMEKERGINTDIVFKNVEIDFDVLEALKKSLDEETGIWSTYSSAWLSFGGAASTLIQRVSAGSLEKRISRELDKTISDQVTADAFRAVANALNAMATEIDAGEKSTENMREGTTHLLAAIRLLNN